jgi:hypothetical protein
MLQTSKNRLTINHHYYNLHLKNFYLSEFDLCQDMINEIKNFLFLCTNINIEDMILDKFKSINDVNIINHVYMFDLTIESKQLLFFSSVNNLYEGYTYENYSHIVNIKIKKIENINTNLQFKDIIGYCDIIIDIILVKPQYNTAVGYHALVTASNNTAIGYNAVGDNNVYMH